MPLKIKPTTGIKERTITRTEHFASKFIIANNGCWEWQGYLSPQGYGIYRSNSAHRQMWELVGNVIDVTKQLDHLCRNTKCINPKHLEQVTNKVNTMRGNTVTSINAKKTHCIHGHPLSGKNLSLKKRNRPGSSIERVCKACNLRNVLAWLSRNNALNKDGVKDVK